MLVLAMDTSGCVLSVVLARDGVILGEVVEETRNRHSAVLMARTSGLLADCGVVPEDLELVAVASGPGTYTGVRVGVTVAKSLAFALGIPLVGMSSLEILARASNGMGVIVAMMDARRESVFGGAYDVEGNVLVDDGHYGLADFLERVMVFGRDGLTFVGDGAIAYEDQILEACSGSEFRVVSRLEQSLASVMVGMIPGREMVQDVHGFVPEYLRVTEAEANLESVDG